MEVKPGYKRTEVGIIPQDWEIRTLSQLAEKVMVGIASAATYAYRKTGVPLFRNQNIRAGILDDKDLLFIAPEYEKAFKTKRLRAGDLITMRTGYPGITAIVPERYEAAQSFTTLITRPKRDEVHSDYLCLYINSQYGRSFFESSKIGGAQKNVNVAALRKMPVILPALGEQRAIAEALNDVNNFLNNFDQLLAKKRDLKQATMQQLLTGQTRLSGFTGEWKLTTLAKMGSVYGGLTGKTKSDFGIGTSSYVSFLDVINSIKIHQKTFDRVLVSDTETQNRVIKGDLLFNGSSETPEEVALCSICDADLPGLYLNSFSFGFRLRADAGADGLFLVYYFRSQEGRELMKSLAQGSTRYNISKTALLKAKLCVPASKHEQAAIASVLADLEGEIAALESRREKTQALKQGMMQELLTGRTRLV